MSKNNEQDMGKRERDRFMSLFNTRYWEFENKDFPLSLEQRLHLVGLTLQQVMTYAYKQADKTLNQEFKPVDKAMEPYRFKIPIDDLISSEEDK
jgi:hypothetical protein